MGQLLSKKIGDRLVAAGAILPVQLNDALRLQRGTPGSKLGDILIGQGAIKRKSLYAALAAQAGLPFFNLVEEGIDPSLPHPSRREDYFRLGVIPVKKQGKAVILATLGLSPELDTWAAKYYPNHYFAITSPYDILWALETHFSAEDLHHASENLQERQPDQSAKFLFRALGWQDIAVWLLIVALGIYFWQATIFGLYSAMNLFFFFALFCKSLFFIAGLISPSSNKDLPLPAMLPVYTLLVPMLHEKRVTIEQLANAIRALDYPKSKLDVKFIVETHDPETKRHIKELALEDYMEIITVPMGGPKTKAKACNYALRFARGQFVTIYDAEDIPEPAQLKKILRIFESSDSSLACVQAKLTYYNSTDSIITRLFTLEYAAWFECMLPGLEKLGIPIPLGGTSNHFRLSVLRELHAWDPYNVTEDADLGLRLAALGYQTKMVDALTEEEATITLKAWFAQRRRWIKGYMLTYLVHMRKPLTLLRTLGAKGFFGFQFFVGAPSLVFLLLPFMLVLSFLHWNGTLLFPEWLGNLAFINLLLAITTHAGFACIVCFYKRFRHLAPMMLIFPFYWILHSLASFPALYDLLIRPHHWHKTEHGLSKRYQMARL